MAEKRISEQELVLPTLYFLNKEPNITMQRLKLLLIDIFKPTGKDIEIAKNRNDTYFEQKVRNLVSHRTLDKLGYATYDNGVQRITELGKRFLETNINILEYLISGDFNYEDVKNSLTSIAEKAEKKQEILAYDENIIIEEGAKRITNTAVYERSKKLREAAIKYYTSNDHIKCYICSFDFFATYGERGKGFIEIHHQKPIFQYNDQDNTMFINQALQNVVPVCSNCHRMIHRNKNAPMPVEDLKQVIEKTKNHAPLDQE